MRSWQSHSNVNAHQIPDFKGSAVRPRSAAGGVVRRAPLSSVSDTAGRQLRAAPRRAAAKLAASPPASPPRGGAEDDGADLTASQLELYTALFGEAPTGKPTPAPSTTEEQHLYADSALLPNLEQAKQIERAVRKAMRGAAIALVDMDAPEMAPLITRLRVFAFPVGLYFSYSADEPIATYTRGPTAGDVVADVLARWAALSAAFGARSCLNCTH